MSVAWGMTDDVLLLDYTTSNYPGTSVWRTSGLQVLFTVIVRTLSVAEHLHIYNGMLVAFEEHLESLACVA